MPRLILHSRTEGDWFPRSSLRDSSPRRRGNGKRLNISSELADSERPPGLLALSLQKRNGFVDLVGRRLTQRNLVNSRELGSAGATVASDDINGGLQKRPVGVVTDLNLKMVHNWCTTREGVRGADTISIESAARSRVLHLQNPSYLGFVGTLTIVPGELVLEVLADRGVEGGAKWHNSCRVTSRGSTGDCVHEESVLRTSSSPTSKSL